MRKSKNQTIRRGLSGKIPDLIKTTIRAPRAELKVGRPITDTDRFILTVKSAKREQAGLPASAGKQVADNSEIDSASSSTSTIGTNVMDPSVSALSEALSVALDREAQIISEQNDAEAKDKNEVRSANRFKSASDETREMFADLIAGSNFGDSSVDQKFVPTFVATKDPKLNSISQLPVLVQLMIGMPVAGEIDDLEMQQSQLQLLLPEMDLTDWVDETSPDLSLQVIDELYRIALSNDRQHILDLADAVLFRAAHQFENPEIFKRVEVRANSIIGPMRSRFQKISTYAKRACFPLQPGERPGTLHDLAFDFTRLSIMLMKVIYYPEAGSSNGLRTSQGGIDPLSITIERMALYTNGLRHDFLSILRRRVQNWAVETMCVESMLTAQANQSHTDKLRGETDTSTDGNKFTSISILLDDVETYEERTGQPGNDLNRVSCLSACLTELSEKWRALDVIADAQQGSGMDRLTANNRILEHKPTITKIGPFTSEFLSISDDDKSSETQSGLDFHGNQRLVVVGKDAASVDNGALGTKTSIVILKGLPKEKNSDLESRLSVYAEELQDVALPLLPVPDLAPIRAELHSMLPHLTSVTDAILNALARTSTLKLPPFLLVGDPGSGKTTLAEELMRLLELPSMTIDAAGGSDGNIFGVDKRWSSGTGGVHLDLLRTSKIANPCLVVDEIDKAGGNDRNGDIRHKLLGLLEPRRASTFFDPFLSVPIDMSGFNFLFTANDLNLVAPPLRNRMSVLHCPYPGPEHLSALAPQLLKAEYKARGMHLDWALPLDGLEYGLLKKHWKGGSIRDLRRFLQAVVDQRDDVNCRHPLSLED